MRINIGRSALSAFEVRNFRVWWVGFLLASVAMMVQTFGVIWLVTDLGLRAGDAGTAAVYLGFVGLARGVPSVVLGLVGGLLADQRDRRNVLVVTQVGWGIVAFVTAALAGAGLATLVPVLLLSAANSSVGAFYHPARLALQPRIVGAERMPSAFGLNTMVLTGSALAGPLLAGLLVLTVGVTGLMAVVTGAYCLVAVIWRAMGPYPAMEAPTKGQLFNKLMSGLRYVRDDAALLKLFVIVGLVAFLVRPFPFLVPAMARDVLDAGPIELSWILSAAGIGAFVSGFVIAWLRLPSRQASVILPVAIAAGGSLLLLSIQRELLPVVILAALTNFAVMLASGLLGLLVQTTTPDHVRGRVMSVQGVLADGVTEAGTLSLGALGGALGPAVALGIGGSLLAGLGVAGLRPRSLARLVSAARLRGRREAPVPPSIETPPAEP